MGIGKTLLLLSITLAVTVCAWSAGTASRVERVRSQNSAARVSKQYRYGRANSRYVETLLARKVDLSALTVNTTFSRAINILCRSTQPALNIVVLWRDLRQNTLVEPTTPILMQGVSDIPLQQGLDLLLRAVSSYPGELSYTVERGVIIVATGGSLPIKYIPRIYDVTDLTGTPADFTPLFATRSYSRQGFRGLGSQPGRTYAPAPRGTRRNYSRTGTRYPGRAPFVYGSLRSRRAGELADLIINSTGPGTWR